MARNTRQRTPKPRPGPVIPPYVSPEERAANRARWWRFAYWTAVALPVVFMAMAIGYSDQMPAGIRAATSQVDAAFGYPVLRLLTLIFG